MSLRMLFAGIAVVSALVSASAGWASNDDPIAPRLEGLGTHHYEISTASEDAQAFFDQGLRLAYGFNHAEAIRSFKEAARLDPKAAMAQWGQALALGPNINDPMPHERELEAVAAIENAQELGSGATEKERDFIAALAGSVPIPVEIRMA